MSYDDDDLETCEHQLTFTSGITGTSTVQCVGAPRESARNTPGG